MHRATRSADERARILTAYDASGLSAPRFADRAKVPRSTFYQWLADRKRRQAGATPLRVARLVRVAAREAPALGDASIVVVLGAARIEVPRGFERAALADVIDVLATHMGRQPS